MSFIRNFRRDEEGATAIEYGLIAALIAVAAMAAMSALGDSIGNTFTEAADEMNNAVSDDASNG
ncbi:Flp family type IVb pilin [Pacificimonas flava]|uniref:Flp family type IVb pilin n=2 Tax=Pacificimonas TaxID=1960290 RepID=A0A219B5W2_9SPHN|nr:MULTISPECIES: Flp family type IVb pilin [Pacificimonas]MBZ6377091.1 Flp family type IVb pilin [Pacificimonas aurantium]OWV33178.1 Flp family type IVb pilin [Pacificimonas flava]